MTVNKNFKRAVRSFADAQGLTYTEALSILLASRDEFQTPAVPALPPPASIIALDELHSLGSAGILFAGLTCTGKTHQLTSLVRQAKQANWLVCIVANVPEMFDELADETCKAVEERKFLTMVKREISARKETPNPVPLLIAADEVMPHYKEDAREALELLVEQGPELSIHVVVTSHGWSFPNYLGARLYTYETIRSQDSRAYTVKHFSDPMSADKIATLPPYGIYSTDEPKSALYPLPLQSSSMKHASLPLGMGEEGLIKLDVEDKAPAMLVSGAAGQGKIHFLQQLARHCLETGSWDVTVEDPRHDWVKTSDMAGYHRVDKLDPVLFEALTKTITVPRGKHHLLILDDDFFNEYGHADEAETKARIETLKVFLRTARSRRIFIIVNSFGSIPEAFTERFSSAVFFAHRRDTDLAYLETPAFLEQVKELAVGEAYFSDGSVLERMRCFDGPPVLQNN